MAELQQRSSSVLPPARYVEDCLSRRVIFFTGKGGVGKSTVAWATALACRKRGAKVAVTSWNPFEEVATPPWAGQMQIHYQPLETLSAFREYVLRLLRFERIYDTVFDNRVLKTFIRAAPGLSETVIAGKIWDLVDKREHDLVIVDMPSSGHAQSFFQSPIGIQKIFPVGWVHSESGKIVRMFGERWCRIDLVATPEELPLFEGLQLKQKLEALYFFHFGFLHINQVTPSFPVPVDPAAGVAAELVERYRARREREEDAMSLAFDYRMETNKIPRLIPHVKTMEDELADVVEKAAGFLGER